MKKAVAGLRKEGLVDMSFTHEEAISFAENLLVLQRVDELESELSLQHEHRAALLHWVQNSSGDINQI